MRWHSKRATARAAGLAPAGRAASSRVILGAVNTDDTPLLRRATAADGAAYIELVRGLARFEALEPPDDAAAARLLEHAFGPRPRYELLLAELGGQVVADDAYPGWPTELEVRGRGRDPESSRGRWRDGRC